MRVTMMAHRDTTGAGTLAEPAGATGLAEHDVAVVGITEGADGGPTVDGDLANFARGHHEGRPATLLIGESGTDAGGTAELATATGLHLEAVHRETCRNVLQGHAIAR